MLQISSRQRHVIRQEFSPKHIYLYNFYMIYYYFIIIILFQLQMGFYPVAAILQYHTSHKITHHTQTKHSTQNYTSNKGHTIQNEYNANMIYNYNKNN
jgi:hypothetical protein